MLPKFTAVKLGPWFKMMFGSTADPPLPLTSPRYSNAWPFSVMVLKLDPENARNELEVVPVYLPNCHSFEGVRKPATNDVLFPDDWLLKYLPAAQSSHFSAPFKEYLPTAHMVQFTPPKPD
jgi:hypothetical protein